MPASYFDFARQVTARGALRMVFLKQFPDAVDATRACYQAIIEAPIRVTGGLRGGLLPGRFGVTIHEYASHPIVDTLGLRTRRRSTDKSELASTLQVWLAFDAQVERGEVVWESVTRQADPARIRMSRARSA